MTEEEAQYYNRLVAQYNQLAAENSRLSNEINYGIQQCNVIGQRIQEVSRTATQEVTGVATRVGDVDEVVEDLNACLTDVTEHYFLFKNLSEASKMLSKYNDEYYTKFHFYHELRRITLGYVIGVDSHIVSSEVLRKKVEKAYLANTDYWLAYATSAVMLWASDEREAANRALNKAMSMDCYKSCVFFMLVNLRFTRVDSARNWYISLLDKTDVNNMSDEWQYVLHAYLVGAMRNDPEFTQMAGSYFARMLEQTEATTANFGQKVVQYASNYAANVVHMTEHEYPMLKTACESYPDMKLLLSDMEKIGLLTQRYDEVYQMEDDAGDTVYEQIENVLYDLVNGYDDEEFKVIKNIRYNEAVIAAKGDTAMASARFNAQYGQIGQTKTFGDLMLGWAFSDDLKETNIMVKRFALSYLKERIGRGVRESFAERYAALKDVYPVSVGICPEIPPYQTECDENAYQSQSEKLTAYCNKHKMGYVFADKYLKIFLLMCAAALLLLAVSAIAVHTRAFAALLAVGLVLGIVSGFLVWRRWVDKNQELAEKIRLANVKLRNILDEMGDWRKRLNAEYAGLDNLIGAIEKF